MGVGINTGMQSFFQNVGMTYFFILKFLKKLPHLFVLIGNKYLASFSPCFISQDLRSHVVHQVCSYLSLHVLTEQLWTSGAA